MTESDEKPLHGIRVLEIGAYLAAPLVGKHMQSLGAEVDVIIRPASARGAEAEEAWRPATTAALRRGKGVHHLDLKDNDVGAERVRGLIARADVVIVGFAPSVAKRLRVDAASCHLLNERCIHLSLPGFSDHEASRMTAPAWEAAILAASGLFRDMGLNRQLQGCVASYSPLPLASAYASVVASLAAVTALLARARGVASAAGATIEVPLASALLEMLVHNSLDIGGAGLPPAYLSRRQRALARKATGATRRTHAYPMDCLLYTSPSPRDS